MGRPELRSPAEAASYLKALHRLVTFLGICDGNMEEGSLRCDANISVRPAGESAFGTRVEVKNINSFRNVKLALACEFERQTELLLRGETFGQETRGWDAAAGETRAQRSKEEAMDYRYFPEPDLPELAIALEEIDAVRASLPELPEARKARFMGRLRPHGLRGLHGPPGPRLRRLLRGRGHGEREREAGRELDARGGQPGAQRPGGQPSTGWACRPRTWPD